LVLGLTFSVAEVLVFAKRLKVLNGFCEKSFGRLLQLTGFGLVVLPDALGVLLRIFRLLVERPLRFSQSHLRFVVNAGCFGFVVLTQPLCLLLFGGELLLKLLLTTRAATRPPRQARVMMTSTIIMGSS